MSFYTPWKHKKLVAFYCFQGVYKDIIGTKSVNTTKEKTLLISHNEKTDVKGYLVTDIYTPNKVVLRDYYCKAYVWVMI